MSFNLAHIIGSMGPMALTVAVALLLFAVASLAVFIERSYTYACYGRRSMAFGKAARPLAKRHDFPALRKAAEVQAATPLATLMEAGASAYLEAYEEGGTLSPAERTRRALDRTSERAEAELRRGLGVLSVTGSVAPFVGLLGTVVGIISAFQGIAAEGSGGLSAVSAGIAEALVVTALGLLVAIPAVLAYHLLTAKSENLLRALDQARGEFMELVENGPVLAKREGQTNSEAEPKARIVFSPPIDIEMV